MDVKLGCEICGCEEARIETVQVFTEAPDYRDWDIHILCHCPHCGHFGRISLKRLVHRIFEDEEQDLRATLPGAIKETSLEDDGA